MIMYKLLKLNNGVIRLSDGACIPFNDDNTDYQAYLEWLSEGNTPLPADEPPEEAIKTITMRQCRIALFEFKVLDYIDENIKLMSRKAQIEWEYSNEIHRDGELVLEIAKNLHYTSSDIDELFLKASNL